MEFVFWVLDSEHRPTPLTDPIEFAEWFTEHQAETIVAQQHIGPVFLSTVFTGMSVISLSSEHPRRLFETMTFVELDEHHPWHHRQWRYDTWEEAAEYHQVIVARLTQEYPPPKLTSGGVLHLPN